MTVPVFPYRTCQAVDTYFFPEDGGSMFLRTGGIQVPDCTYYHNTNFHPNYVELVDYFISLYFAA
jgi:hypothetical protein